MFCVMKALPDYQHGNLADNNDIRDAGVRARNRFVERAFLNNLLG